MPVIHVLNEEQILRNISLAKSNEADGVFLINHGSMSWETHVDLYSKSVQTYPDFWIGINCLDLSTHEVFSKVPNTIDGIWADNGGIDDESTLYAKRISRYRKRSSFTGLYFGGVAFKGHYVENHTRAAKRATRFMEIVTTSGAGTGKAAPTEKIASMKEAIGDRPLAIASGVTIENVQDYLPYVEYFLVATGISRTFHELDPEKVLNLSKAIHEYQN